MSTDNKKLEGQGKRRRDFMTKSAKMLYVAPAVALLASNRTADADPVSGGISTIDVTLTFIAITPFFTPAP